jgi:hypothetical protein
VLFLERLKAFIQAAHVMVLVSFTNVDKNLRNIIDLFGDLVFNV